MRTHRSGRAIAPAHPPSHTASLLVVLLALTTICGTGEALASTPDQSPGASTVTLVADGPFGRVEGAATSPGAAAPDPATLPVLDAWARGTSVTLRPTSGSLSPWRASALAEPALDPASTVDLGAGDGDAVIRLAETGLFLVRVDATIRPDGGALEGTWWWRIAVPDRGLPDGETGPPPPTIVLRAGAEVASLEQGSGCFLGTCGDIGGISPPELLPTIRTITAAPLSLSLSDASDMVRWSIEATRVGDTAGASTTLGQGEDLGEPVAWVVAPPTGDWLVEVSVTYDRERGHGDGYGRLLVSAPPPG
jgi:hypothetical protein